MDRINSAGAQIIGGIRQWINKNLLAGVAGTQFDATYENDFQEEMVHAFIEASGQTPTAGVQNQVKAATDFFYGMKYTALSAAHTVAVADRGQVFRCGSGCTAISLPAASGFDAGFMVGFVGNTNTTTITLAAGNIDDDETLKGDSTIVIGVGDFVLLQPQGSNWGVIAASEGLSAVHGAAFYSAAGSGSWTCPNGVWTIRATLTGGGANGASSSAAGSGAYYSGGGGGAGATAKFVAAVVPGQSYGYTVGTAANNSYFMGVTAGGGSAPSSSSGSSSGGIGGSVTGSATGLLGTQVNILGGDGGDGGGSTYSGGGYTGAYVFAGNGGGSFWGGGGRAGLPSGDGGKAPGSGGGGSYGGGSGGAGAPGALLIEY